MTILELRCELNSLMNYKVKFVKEYIAEFNRHIKHHINSDYSVNIDNDSLKITILKTNFEEDEFGNNSAYIYNLELLLGYELSVNIDCSHSNNPNININLSNVDDCLFACKILKYYEESEEFKQLIAKYDILSKDILLKCNKILKDIEALK